MNNKSSTKILSNYYDIIDKIKKMNNCKRFNEEFSKSEVYINKRKKEVELFLEKAPVVSIIMPTYNRGNIIMNSINSVLSQSYSNWELLVCDDGSTDNTQKIIKKIKNEKIKYFKLRKKGAASARNYGLSKAKGEYIAYLDTDNIWSPNYLSVMIGTLVKNKGYFCAFSKYIDINISNNNYKLKTFRSLKFNYEKLMEKNFIDLNSFIHRRELYEHLGGFNEKLVRQQDWDLILKYTFLRDPIYIDAYMVIYQRNSSWNQITLLRKNDMSSVRIIKNNVRNYFSHGFSSIKKHEKKSITILSWDICRNHFSKAYNIAEALSEDYKVQLLGFRFFENDIFEPYKNEQSSFETTYIDACNFPDFDKIFKDAISQIKGDVIYAVKPRLSSLGLGLYANYYLKKPLILEFNDLETVVSNPQKHNIDEDFSLKTINLNNKDLLIPYSVIWSKIMERFACKLPLTTTHNKNLNKYFGGRSFYIRNLKDEKFYNPNIYSRDKIRTELGFSSEDRIILFGGMLRKHKGIYQLVELLKKLEDKRYKILFVSSRITPDQKKFEQQYGHMVKILPAHGRNEMSKINYASDLVILWLDQKIPASNYQMPFKLTDAIAMNVPVIVNDVSDLGDLGRDGYLRVVEYGNFNLLIDTINDIFSNKEKTKSMTQNARSLYLRQFSYQSIKKQIDIIYDIALKEQKKTLKASDEFVEFFNRFCKGIER